MGRDVPPLPEPEHVKYAGDLDDWPPAFAVRLPGKRLPLYYTTRTVLIVAAVAFLAGVAAAFAVALAVEEMTS